MSLIYRRDIQLNNISVIIGIATIQIINYFYEKLKLFTAFFNDNQQQLTMIESKNNKQTTIHQKCFS